MTNIELQKETDIQNEHQSNWKRKIVDEIINILADNNLSIVESRDILYIVSKKLGQQKVKVIS